MDFTIYDGQRKNQVFMLDLVVVEVSVTIGIAFVNVDVNNLDED